MTGSYRLKPYTYLNGEIIGRLAIHQGADSLRRAISLSPCVKRVARNSSMPTIYYIKGDAGREINDWRAHILMEDVSEFILRNISVRNGWYDLPTPSLMPENGDEEGVIEVPGRPDLSGFHRSTIRWDGVIGKCDGAELKTINGNGHMMFDGDIKWYEKGALFDGSPQGNYVGLVITLLESRERFPNMRLRVKDHLDLRYETEATWDDLEEGNRFHWICHLRSPLEERSVAIVWEGEETLENPYLEMFTINTSIGITFRDGEEGLNRTEK